MNGMERWSDVVDNERLSPWASTGKVPKILKANGKGCASQEGIVSC